MKIENNLVYRNRKLILFYSIIVFSLVLIIFNYENYVSPFKELLIILVLLIEGVFSIIYFKKNHENLHKVAFTIILIFGITCLLLTPHFYCK